MNIIGQEKLVKILDSYTLQNMPRALLFLGQSGCGKTYFAHYLAEKLGLETVDIDSKTTSQQLIEYSQCPIEKLYLIDLCEIDEKQQNKFLKFIEEPSSTTYIVAMAESEIGILPTILNRCQKHYFETYTIEQLQTLSWVTTSTNELTYKLCTTPGQLLELADVDIDKLYRFCYSVITEMHRANYANAISIYTKVNCKDSYDKFDFKLFLKTLTYVAFEVYIKENNEFSFNVYKYLIEKQAEMLNKSLAKENCLINILDHIWRLAH